MTNRWASGEKATDRTAFACSDNAATFAPRIHLPDPGFTRNGGGEKAAISREGGHHGASLRWERCFQFTRGIIPQLDARARGNSEESPVRRLRQNAALTHVDPSEGNLDPGRHVPALHLDLPVRHQGMGQERFPVVPEAKAKNGDSLRSKLLHQSVAAQVPDLDGAVQAADGQQALVRRKGHAVMVGAQGGKALEFAWRSLTSQMITGSFGDAVIRRRLSGVNGAP